MSKYVKIASKDFDEIEVQEVKIFFSIMLLLYVHFHLFE